MFIFIVINFPCSAATGRANGKLVFFHKAHNRKLEENNLIFAQKIYFNYQEKFLESSASFSLRLFLNLIPKPLKSIVFSIYFSSIKCWSIRL